MGYTSFGTHISHIEVLEAQCMWARRGMQAQHCLCSWLSFMLHSLCFFAHCIERSSKTTFNWWAIDQFKCQINLLMMAEPDFQTAAASVSTVRDPFCIKFNCWQIYAYGHHAEPPVLRCAACVCTFAGEGSPQSPRARWWCIIQGAWFWTAPWDVIEASRRYRLDRNDSWRLGSRRITHQSSKEQTYFSTWSRACTNGCKTSMVKPIYKEIYAVLRRARLYFQQGGIWRVDLCLKLRLEPQSQLDFQK